VAYEDTPEKQRSIAVNVAAKVATDLTRIAVELNTDGETVLGIFDEILAGSVASVLKQQTDAAAVAAVTSAFPGTTFQPSAPVTFAPNPQPAPQTPTGGGFNPGPSPFPAQQYPVPGATAPATQGPDPETAQYWELFFQDIQTGAWQQNWEDVRGSKKSDKSPDFRHRTLKDSGGKYRVSLWTSGKKNPENLAARLAAVGIQ
jgi:hypothetical protein